jgi:hypothetical protein
MRHTNPGRAPEPNAAAGVCLAFAALTASASAQNQREYLARPAAAIVSSGQAAFDTNPQPAVLIREIDDPHLGSRWLLYRDPAHPGGPGRLVRIGSMAPDRARSSASVADAAAAPRSIIRAGDRVVLEEDTPVVDARLEAVALGPALAGAPLQVRLAIGGRVLAAIAIAPGRVALAPGLETRP